MLNITEDLVCFSLLEALVRLIFLCKDRSLSLQSGARRPPKRPRSDSSASRFGQRPSDVASSRTSPAPSSSSSSRPPRSARVKKLVAVEQASVGRHGLKIEPYKVDIHRHKGKYSAKEFASFSVTAKNLPHIASHFGRLQGQSSSPRELQRIFSRVIEANTRDDEPDAPRISIVNDINPDAEPTPPGDYYYSNLMVHHDGVPKPQCRVSMLPHCKCIGGCKPQSCPCAKRQMDHLPPFTKWSGFAYVANRKLRPGMLGYPIMECNMYCGCNDECQNRVRILKNLIFFSVLNSNM